MAQYQKNAKHSPSNFQGDAWFSRIQDQSTQSLSNLWGDVLLLLFSQFRQDARPSCIQHQSTQQTTADAFWKGNISKMLLTLPTENWLVRRKIKKAELPVSPAPLDGPTAWNEREQKESV